MTSASWRHAPPARAGIPSPLQWNEVDWVRIAQTAAVVRTTHTHFVDKRNAAIIKLHQEGAPLTGIAELYNCSVKYIATIVGLNHTSLGAGRHQPEPKAPEPKPKPTSKAGINHVAHLADNPPLRGHQRFNPRPRRNQPSAGFPLPPSVPPPTRESAR